MSSFSTFFVARSRWRVAGASIELPDDGSPAPLVLDFRCGVGTLAARGCGRARLAKGFPTDDAEGPAYTARILKIIDKRRSKALLGVVRILADGSWRLSPVNVARRNTRSDGRSPRAMPRLRLGRKPSRSRRAATACRRAKVLPDRWQDGLEKSASLIAESMAHESPHIPRRSDRRARNGGRFRHRARSKTGARCRTDHHRSVRRAHDHDDAVHAEPDTDEKKPRGAYVDRWHGRHWPMWALHQAGAQAWTGGST